MANTFAPFGFRQFGTQEGNSPTYGLTRRYLASSDTNSYFTGDVVKLSSGANPGFITLPTAGSTDPEGILGIFAGCEFFSPTVGRVVWSSFFTASVGSSSPCNAYIIEGEDNLFLAQASTNAVVGTSCIGLNVGINSTSAQSAGNTTTGVSNVALASTSMGSTSTLPFRVVDTTSNYFPPGTNGADGTTAGAILVVAFNNQARRTLTGASG